MPHSSPAHSTMGSGGGIVRAASPTVNTRFHAAATCLRHTLVLETRFAINFGVVDLNYTVYRSRVQIRTHVSGHPDAQTVSQRADSIKMDAFFVSSTASVPVAGHEVSRPVLLELLRLEILDHDNDIIIVLLIVDYQLAVHLSAPKT